MGTCPTAYVFGKKFLGKDIRRLGDGNMGARNAYFEINHKIGILVAVIDGAKGLLAVLMAKWLDASQPVVLFTGLAAVAGHNFPFFLRFRGGRGEATTIGVLLGIIPQTTLIMGLPTILTLMVLKNVMLASAVMFIGVLLVNWWLDTPGLLTAYAIALPIIVALTHFFRARHTEKPAGAGT
jgi:glycerol-3-phosphate acyltransferase PlsY